MEYHSVKQLIACLASLRLRILTFGLQPGEALNGDEGASEWEQVQMGRDRGGRMQSDGNRFSLSRRRGDQFH